MGVVADSVGVSEADWPAALSRVSAAGVLVTDEGSERGLSWYGCRRGNCRVGLGYCPGDGGREVTVYGPVQHFWRRPLGMWQLYRDVLRALESSEPTSAAVGEVE